MSTGGTTILLIRSARNVGHVKRPLFQADVIQGLFSV